VTTEMGNDMTDADPDPTILPIESDLAPSDPVEPCATHRPPHKRRRRARPDVLAAIAAGAEALSAGILAPVRTYESAGRRAAEAAGFEPVGQVSMLVREVLASVRQPAMVPAI